MDVLPDRPAQGRNCAERGTPRIVRARLTARSARSWTGSSGFDLETTAETAPPRSFKCCSGSRLVDDLELSEFGEAFLGEFGADARLLGAAERNVRRHIEMLVDPDRAGLDAARDLVGA